MSPGKGNSNTNRDDRNYLNGFKFGGNEASTMLMYIWLRPSVKHTVSETVVREHEQIEKQTDGERER